MNRKMKKALKAKGIKVKKRSLGLLKKLAWKAFSEWVRRKDANPDGFNNCVCCGRSYHWKSLHAGHLVAGRRLGILFDERGVWPVCYGCNVMKAGNYREYDAFLDRELGQEYRIKLVEELRMLSKQPTKWAREQFEEVIAKYKGLLDGMPK